MSGSSQVLIWSLSSECVTNSEMAVLKQIMGSHLWGALLKHWGVDAGARPLVLVLLGLSVSHLLKTSAVQPVDISIYHSDKFFDSLPKKLTGFAREEEKWDCRVWHPWHVTLCSSSTGSHFSMLGIGDIVMPGLLLCFVLRYDNYKKQANGDSCGASGPANISGRMQKVSYFHCTLIGYFVGKRTELCDPYPGCPPPLERGGR